MKNINLKMLPYFTTSSLILINKYEYELIISCSYSNFYLYILLPVFCIYRKMKAKKFITSVDIIILCAFNNE